MRDTCEDEMPPMPSDFTRSTTSGPALYVGLDDDRVQRS
jgi:hypothetical protein